MRIGRLLPACLVLAALAAAMPASAGRRGHDGESYVTAVSRHGNGTVTGAVRDRRRGLEVQLPGGTWVGCRRSCSETLRVETVDFWENQGSLVGAGTFHNECGFFGCLEVGR
jgi:hypothetical protein